MANRLKRTDEARRVRRLYSLHGGKLPTQKSIKGTNALLKLLKSFPSGFAGRKREEHWQLTESQKKARRRAFKKYQQRKKVSALRKIAKK